VRERGAALLQIAEGQTAHGWPMGWPVMAGSKGVIRTRCTPGWISTKPRGGPGWWAGLVGRAGGPGWWAGLVGRAGGPGWWALSLCTGARIGVGFEQDEQEEQAQQRTREQAGEQRRHQPAG